MTGTGSRSAPRDLGPLAVAPGSASGVLSSASPTGSFCRCQANWVRAAAGTTIEEPLPADGPRQEPGSRPNQGISRSDTSTIAREPWAQSDPPAHVSRFHIGTVAFTMSRQSRAASKASDRCGAATTTATETSPTESTPTRWSSAIRRTGGNRARHGAHDVRHLRGDVRLVGLVLQLDDARPAFGLVADRPAERDDGAAVRLGSPGQRLGNRQFVGRDRDPVLVIVVRHREIDGRPDNPSRSHEPRAPETPDDGPAPCPGVDRSRPGSRLRPSTGRLPRRATGARRRGGWHLGAGTLRSVRCGRSSTTSTGGGRLVGEWRWPGSSASRVRLPASLEPRWP